MPGIPAVAEMMARDGASRGLGIELIDAASAEIVFVAPARTGDVLMAEAVVRTRFGRSGVYDVTVRRGTDVIAEFRGRSHQLAPVREPS